MTIAATRRLVWSFAIISALALITSASAASTETYTVHTEYGRPSPTDSEQTWLDTGVTLLGGTVTVTGDGEAVNCDRSLPCKNPVPFGPDGNGLGTCFVVGYVCTAPDLSAYALLAAIGSGPPLLVGSGPVALTGQGRIYLAYNDGKYGDNCIGNPRPCGALDATIEPLYDLNTNTLIIDGRRTGLRKVTQIIVTLHDDAGANVSSADKVVRALTLVNPATGEEAEIVSPGLPNPEYIFSFSGGAYRFHVDYTDLAPGTWELSFAVNDVTTTWYVVNIPV
jgi:hypothetical protein